MRTRTMTLSLLVAWLMAGAALGVESYCIDFTEPIAGPPPFWSYGDVLWIEGVAIHVSGAYPAPPLSSACVNPSVTSCCASLDYNDNACGSSPEMQFDAVRLEFFLPQPVQELSIRVRQITDWLSFEVNGACEHVLSPLNLPSNMGGVQVEVFLAQAFGPTEHCWIIKLTGPVHNFDIGGTDLWIDDICVGDDAWDPDADADNVAPEITHPAGGDTATHPCSGFIDPARESDNGFDLNQGITEVTIIFSEQVRDLDGSGTELTADAFTVYETGEGTPPTVVGFFTDGSVPGPQSVLLRLSRPITLQEWTTIVAEVEDLHGNPIDSSGGDMGPGVNEPDRVDIGFLPGDITQDGETGPFDLLAFRQLANQGELPPDGCSADPLDYGDLNRDGASTPFDLLALRQLVNGAPPATRAWAGATMNTDQP